MKNKTTNQENPASSSSKRIPVSISLSDFDNVSTHWHDSIELLFVLAGKCDFQVHEERFTITEGHLILTNAKTMHSCHISEKCIHVTCHIQIDQLPLLQNQMNREFTVNSVKYPHPTKYQRLKFLMAKLIKVQAQDDCNCGTMSVIYDIMSELIRNFSTTESTMPPALSSRQSSRKGEILAYIMENYKKGLTLQTVADAQFLSVPYLSSFFKKNMGVTFTEYYNSLRMQHAVDDLLTSDLTIDEVAHSNGFSDSRTFLRLFKEKYHMLPSAFRKKNCQNSEHIPIQSGEASLFYPSIGKTTYLPLINRYMNSENIVENTALGIQQIRCDDISFAETGTPLVHSFHKFCSISSAKALLYSEIQNMLRSLQADIGYEYICFYGLLNIDTFLYSEKPDGTPSFTFALVDKIFDFLLSINLL